EIYTLSLHDALPIFGDDLPILPQAQKAPEALDHPGQPRPAAWFGPVDDQILDLRVRPLRGAEVASLPWLVDGAHEVQMLRRRLLLQPHGFERVDPRGANNAGMRLAVAQGPCVEELRRDRHAACVPRAGQPDAHKYAGRDI